MTDAGDVCDKLAQVFQEEAWKVTRHPTWGQERLSFDLIAENQVAVVFVEVVAALADAARNLERQHTELAAIQNALELGPKATELYLIKLVTDDSDWDEQKKDEMEGDLYFARKVVWRVGDLVQGFSNLHSAIRSRLGFLFPFKIVGNLAPISPERQVLKIITRSGLSEELAETMLNGLSRPVGVCNCNKVLEGMETQ